MSNSPQRSVLNCAFFVNGSELMQLSISVSYCSEDGLTLAALVTIALEGRLSWTAPRVGKASWRLHSRQLAILILKLNVRANRRAPFATVLALQGVFLFRFQLFQLRFDLYPVAAVSEVGHGLLLLLDLVFVFLHDRLHGGLSIVLWSDLLAEVAALTSVTGPPYDFALAVAFAFDFLIRLLKAFFTIDWRNLFSNL